MTLPLIVVEAGVASIDNNLFLTGSDGFPFKLFNSISLWDNVTIGKLMGFLDEFDDGGTFFSVDRTALV